VSLSAKSDGSRLDGFAEQREPRRDSKQELLLEMMMWKQKPVAVEALKDLFHF
jgi:hypothetical protein